MPPEDVNRLRNTSSEDFDEFVAWLTSTVLSEAMAASGDAVATKAAWIAYFRRGLKADMLLGELMDLLPGILPRVGYAPDEAQRVVQMLKRTNFDDLGIRRTERGLKFDENTR